MTAVKIELRDWINEQAAKPAVKNRTTGKRLDHRKIGVMAMDEWGKRKSPTADELAEATNEPLHATRLWCGVGTARMVGLELDSNQVTERVHDPISGAVKKRIRNSFPPTSRNFAVVLQQLAGKGEDLDEIANELGYDDQEHLQNSIIEKTVSELPAEDELDDFILDFDE